jgi:Mn2+/Fe2+ NRAMP family transporter
MTNDISADLPKTCLPTWEVTDLPEPKPLGWRNLAGLIGPGIVMCGIQIGGGEWLFGPDITAKYGGGLMWIATIAIIVQVFYNIECGRYALYCGEPVFTGFLRTRPGPGFWIGVALLLNLASLIPGLTTHAAVLISTLYLGRPPTPADAVLVNTLAYACLSAVVLPVLVGGKVYNTLQFVMTIKVIAVLGFCLFMGLFFVSAAGWAEVFSGFVKFGNVPVKGPDGKEVVVNAFSHWMETGNLPVLALASIATLGAFAGYAGGGGLSNSAYSNFVRDKGWGMGGQVGAIASAVGGRNITLSHVGKVFPINTDNLRKWKAWWKYILCDQLIIWMPGCFMGMALPALLSIQFARQSSMYGKDLPYTQTLIVADGIRSSQDLAEFAPLLSVIAIVVGLIVFLPSQMSVVDDVSRRWTDIIWTSNSRVRQHLKPNQVSRVYYTILVLYVVLSFVMITIFLRYGETDVAKQMVTVIANLNNVAIGATAFHVLWINTRFLPRELRPRWYQRVGIISCGVFYLGLSAVVFQTKIWPILTGLFD